MGVIGFRYILKEKKKEFVDGLDVGFEKKYETSVTARCGAGHLH